MAPDPGGPEHSRLRALARDVDRTGRRVGELDTLVRQLSADVAALVGGLNPASPGSGAAGEAHLGVRSWLLVEDQERAHTDIDDLIQWLDAVYLAYPGATLPTCWLWHPSLVEELWWLRQAHAEAYHPVVGSWIRVGDWHDRLRPNVVRRIRQAAVACELSLHRPGAEKGHPSLVAPLSQAAQTIAAWAAAGRPDPAPEPTPAELEAAEQVHRDGLARSRR